MKKKFLTTMLIMGGVISTLFFSSSTEEDTSQDTFEQEPPMPMQYKIQKLAAPLSTGETMVFRVDYFRDETLPNTIKIYTSGDIDVILKDDGTAPDITAGDFEYATYLKTNPVKFVDLVQSYEQIINEKGSILDFNGHDGKVIPAAEITNFDFIAFNNNEPVGISESLLSAAQCGTELKKENSLFITDIDVVEDPARSYYIGDPASPFNGTFNKNNPGTALGEYTFGHLMKNIVNDPTQDATKNFLKNWLITWNTNQNIGQDIILGREGIGVGQANQNTLATIWLTAAKRLTNPNWILTNTALWQTEWDNLNEMDLLVAAPFKLTAIVNRIDLRGNGAFKNTIANAGETRLIYTLVDPHHLSIASPNNSTIPIHINPGPGGLGKIDWMGCNIILEYSNQQKTTCEIQALAQEWYDLSSFSDRSSSAYRDALAAIVRKVTDANTNSQSPTKSALARIRTNEKMFSPFEAQGAVGFYSGNWNMSTWQLRQFEINSAKELMPTYVTNTPKELDNGDPDNPRTAINTPNDNNILIGFTSDPVITWVMSSPVMMERVRRGNFNIPQNLLATSALLRQEIAEYYDFDYTENSAAIQARFSNTDPTANAKLKEIRHQISLNRCQGCHGGETQTVFTQVRPMDIGNAQQPKYWENTPGYIPGDIDQRTKFVFSPSSSTPNGPSRGINIENTYDDYLQTNVDNLARSRVVSNTYHQTVSPFLTGRRYTSNGGFDDASKTFTGNVGWQDDELNDVGKETENVPVNGNLVNIKADDKLTGLFYVNDPSNQALLSPVGYSSAIPQTHNDKFKYNDLQRRKDDLCKLLQTCCNCGLSVNTSPNVPLELIKALSFTPFPNGSH
jgi:hypothetical protein